jgi:hypothetical protein
MVVVTALESGQQAAGVGFVQHEYVVTEFVVQG